MTSLSLVLLHMGIYILVLQLDFMVHIPLSLSIIVSVFKLIEVSTNHQINYLMLEITYHVFMATVNFHMRCCWVLLKKNHKLKIRLEKIRQEHRHVTVSNHAIISHQQHIYILNVETMIVGFLKEYNNINILSMGSIYITSRCVHQIKPGRH